MRSDIVPGATFPDYALPDHTGTVRTLSELQGRRSPMAEVCPPQVLGIPPGPTAAASC